PAALPGNHLADLVDWIESGNFEVIFGGAAAPFRSFSASGISSSGGVLGQTMPIRSACRRDRSWKVRSTPLMGSRRVVPVNDGGGADSPPEKRTPMCAPAVPVSLAEWQPLQVCSANWCRASLLLMPAANHNR